MKRILYIIDGLGLGGAERTVVQLATGFADRGYSVHVIAVPRHTFLLTPQPSVRGCFDELIEQGIGVTVIPKQRRFSLRFFYTLYKTIRAFRPDVVHTQLYTADTFGAFAARFAGVDHIVSTEQNINVDEGRFKTFMKGVAHGVHQDVACISEAVKTYVQRTGMYAKRYTLPIIHNSVESKRFASIAPLHAQNTHVPVMSMIGRLVPQKGHIRLLRALAHVQVPFRLRIVGSGMLEDDIRSTITTMHLEDRVTLEPARRDIEAVYATSDIVIFPSVWEGLGIVALEAQAAARPVIVSAVDGLREVVRDGITGRVVDFTRQEESVRVCEELLRDSELRARMGHAGREYVTTHFSTEQMLDQYERWYEQL